MQDQINKFIQTVADMQGQMDDLREQLNASQEREATLQATIDTLSDVSSLSLDLQNALIARGFIRVDQNLGAGIVYSNGDGTFSVISGVGGGFYVATISGGAVTTFVDFSSGVRTT